MRRIGVARSRAATAFRYRAAVRTSEVAEEPVSVAGGGAEELWALGLGIEGVSGRDRQWQPWAAEREPAVLTSPVLGSLEATAAVALVLLLALAVQALTVVELGHLLALHVAVGAGIGALALAKVVSVARRALAWHRGEAWARARPAPTLVARALGAALVAATAAVLATGATILLVGHTEVLAAREAHIVAFVVWAGLVALHLLRNGLRALVASLDAVGLGGGRRAPRPARGAGAWWRGIALAGGTLAAGLAFGALVVSQFAPRIATLQSHLANVHLPI